MSRSRRKIFFKSQNMFYNWRHERYETSCCMYQSFDFELGILFEKWKSFDENGKAIFYIVEIHSRGDGFSIYELT